MSRDLEKTKDKIARNNSKQEKAPKGIIEKTNFQMRKLSEP
jgi:hypothetical protein